MNKKIGVFFNESDKYGYPLNEEDYFNAYSELNNEIKNLDSNLYILRSQNTYLGNGLFTNSWQFNSGELISTGKIKVDIVYDKGVFVSDGLVKVLNNEYLNEICTDKYLSYKTFPKYFSKTILVNNNLEFLSALKNIEGDIKVIKPIDGESGKGIFFGDDEKLKKVNKKYPFIIQEFLDSSSGIPGICNGMHDFRIAILNGDFIYSYYRTPAHGSYMANVAKGGELHVVTYEKIKKELLDIVKEIDEFFSDYPNRFYGVDFVYTPKGIRIIELNSRLGLLPNSYHKVFKVLKEKLSRVLVNI